MSRIHAIALVGALAFATWLASPGIARAQPYFLAWAVPAGTTPTCELTQNPAANTPPLLDPFRIPVGGSPTALDLCFMVWPVTPSDPMLTPCDKPATGPAAAGTESCAELLQFTTNTGMSVESATGVPGTQFPNYDVRAPMLGSTSSTVTVMGGDPLDGQLGVMSPLQGVKVATVSLLGQGSAGNFELQGGSYVRADLERIDLNANIVIAEVEDTCSDGIVDAGEDCDDGVNDYVSGCSPACTTPHFIWFEGRAGTPTAGTVEFDLDAAAISLGVQVNAPADEVADAAVQRIELEGAAAATVGRTSAGISEPEVAATTGTILTATVNDPGTLDHTYVPEPTEVVLLVSGLAFLVGIGRSRMRQ